MDIYSLIPEFLVLSVSGAALSIAAYSAFEDNNEDKKLLLVIASLFSFAFLVIFILAYISMDNMDTVPNILALFFYVLIFLAMSSIVGFVIHRLREDQKFKDDELDSAIDVIESSIDGLKSSINLFEHKKE